MITLLRFQCSLTTREIKRSVLWWVEFWSLKKRMCWGWWAEWILLECINLITKKKIKAGQSNIQNMLILQEVPQPEFMSKHELQWTEEEKKSFKEFEKKQRSSVRRKRNTEKYDFDNTLQGYFIQNAVGFNCQASKMKTKTPKWSIQHILYSKSSETI